MGGLGGGRKRGGGFWPGERFPWNRWKAFPHLRSLDYVWPLSQHLQPPKRGTLCWWEGSPLRDVSPVSPTGLGL